MSTLAPGIHQADIIIGKALEYGLSDIRANPWLLDYCFAGLVNDPLTEAEYGAQQIQQASKWFLENNVPVIMAYRVDGPPPIPCLSVSLLGSDEAENTLGDVHYDPAEPLTMEPIPQLDLAGPFDQIAYDQASGKLTFLETNSLITSSGQIIVTRTGQVIPIVRGGGKTECWLATGLVADLRGMVIRGQPPGRVIALESAAFTEQYAVGCHAFTPAETLYLHSIVTFCLLRYRETLLEARGLGESSIASADLKKNPAFEEVGLGEPCYSRYMTVRGRVRNYWPKRVHQIVSGVVLEQLIEEVPIDEELAAESGTPVLSWENR